MVKIETVVIILKKLGNFIVHRNFGNNNNNDDDNNSNNNNDNNSNCNNNNNNKAEIMSCFI